MGLRFFKRTKLFPGVTLNMSKSGPSLSFGPRGLKHTIGPRGSRTTVGVPGTGLSYTFGGGKGKPAVASSQPTAGTREPLLKISDDAASVDEERALLRAVIAFQSGKVDQALRHLEAAKGLADAFWLGGMIHLQASRWSEAERDLDAAIRIGSLGEAFERNGINAEIAYPITDELTAHIGPNPQATRLALAEACQELDRNAVAIQHLEAFLKLDPKDPVAAISYAEIALEAEGTGSEVLLQAVSHLKATLTPGPFFWIASLMCGRVQSRLGRPEDAILSFMAAIQLDDLPNSIPLLLRYEMALCYGETGDRTRCRQELSAVYALDPNFADVGQRLGARTGG